MTLIVRKQALGTKKHKACDFLWYEGTKMIVSFVCDEQPVKYEIKRQNATIVAEDIIGAFFNDTIGFCKTIKFDNCQEADYNSWILGDE